MPPARYILVLAGKNVTTKLVLMINNCYFCIDWVVNVLFCVLIVLRNPIQIYRLDPYFANFVSVPDPTQALKVFFFFRILNTGFKKNVFCSEFLGSQFFRLMTRIVFSALDPHKFLCGSVSRISKMSIRILIQGGKHKRRKITPTNFQQIFQNNITNH